MGVSVQPEQYRSGPVQVRVPATSANLGPGFDALGLAVTHHDELTVQVTSAGLSVEVSGEGADEVPRDASHLVVRAMRAAFDALGGRPGGLAVRCVNRIPHARGLGSSSAAIVAGVLAARALVTDGDRVLDDAAALRIAAAVEGHPDNVAPCMLGGFTIAWTDSSGARAVRLEPSPDVRPVLFVPADRGLTAQARGMLPDRVPHADAAANAARAALLVHALTADPTLLLPATEDRLHQDYRAPAMTRSAALVHHLRAAGVAAMISGAGPAVLALAGPGQDPTGLAGSGFQPLPLAIDRRGAVVTA